MAGDVVAGVVAGVVAHPPGHCLFGYHGRQNLRMAEWLGAAWGYLPLLFFCYLWSIM